MKLFNKSVFYKNKVSEETAMLPAGVETAFFITVFSLACSVGDLYSFSLFFLCFHFFVIPRCFGRVLFSYKHAKRNYFLYKTCVRRTVVALYHVHVRSVDSL